MCKNPYIMVNPSFKRLFHTKSVDMFHFENVDKPLSHASFGFRNWFFRLDASIAERNSPDFSTPYDRHKEDLLSLDDHFYFYNSLTGKRYPMFFLAPCNKCSDCFRSKYIEYSSRLSLEALSYDYPPIFFTLTYDEQHIPSDRCVNKDDIKGFIKRMQTYIARDKYFPSHDCVRFFIVSEYGPLHGRPHYHGLLFGVPLNTIEDFFTFDDVIHSSWKLCAPINLKWEVARSIVGCSRYVSKYIIKGLKSGNVPDGCKPNFLSTPRSIGLGGLCLRNPDILDKIFHSTDGTILLQSPSPYSEKGVCGVSRIKIPKFIIDKIFPPYSRVFSSNIKRHISWMCSSFERINTRLSCVDRVSFYKILNLLGAYNFRNSSFFDFKGGTPYDKPSIVSYYVNSEGEYFSHLGEGADPSDYFPITIFQHVNNLSLSDNLRVFKFSLRFLLSYLVDFQFLEIDQCRRDSFKEPISSQNLKWLKEHPNKLNNVIWYQDLNKITNLDYSLNL